MTELTPDLATVLYDQRVDGYLHLTGTVLLVYDHLLTLKSEVRYIWAPRKISAIAWYFLLRYFGLCANLAMFPLAFGNVSKKVCLSYETFIQDLNPLRSCVGLYGAADLLILLEVVLVEMTLSLRVLAIYSVARRGKYFVAAVAIIVIALGAWTVKNVSPVLASPGCYSETPAHRQLQIAGLWEAMFVTDLDAGFPSGSLWHVVVRDGVIYYWLGVHFIPDISLITPPLNSVICIANLTNIIIYYSIDDSNINAGLSAFTAALSVTAASRLMLNLREVASVDDLTSTVSGSLHFVDGTAPLDATDSAP
ncbi:hypothetical protein MSAN_02497900 [Mycena sanguinolenta]|uniref:DUF6533 domain-containing protein n=1 Tax=Mycena sanguinolenta TaxID=230812 RepID=A0A8H6WU35_9AGAR|nr:hypothetical protein MSAN_02497900 [Mycena sanguinolenta]